VSPRRTAAEASGTRTRIVDRAVEVASVEGLEGLTIGRLAGDLELSKAGLFGHFGSKEALQLAALDHAVAVFRERVWEVAAGAEPGLPRLRAVCKAWIAYLANGAFPGGCFLTAASCEFDDRPAGPVREKVAKTLALWLGVLENDARIAVEAGDLDADPAELAFTLNSLAMGANQALRLHRDRRARVYALRAMNRALGVDDP
jgi:AcrR family transcriptional regulator